MSFRNKKLKRKDLSDTSQKIKKILKYLLDLHSEETCYVVGTKKNFAKKLHCERVSEEKLKLWIKLYIIINFSPTTFRYTVFCFLNDEYGEWNEISGRIMCIMHNSSF